MRVSSLVVVLALSGCAYRPHSFTGLEGPFGGKRAVVGCLDLAVASARDRAARGPVVSVTFANRCDRPVRVDLTTMRVTGDSGAGGPARALAVYDPQGSIRPDWLEANSIGRELFELVPPAGEPRPARLCIDLSQVTDGPAEGGADDVCVTP